MEVKPSIEAMCFCLSEEQIQPFPKTQEMSSVKGSLPLPYASMVKMVGGNKSMREKIGKKRLGEKNRIGVAVEKC